MLTNTDILQLTQDDLQRMRAAADRIEHLRSAPEDHGYLRTDARRLEMEAIQQWGVGDPGALRAIVMTHHRLTTEAILRLPNVTTLRAAIQCMRVLGGRLLWTKNAGGWQVSVAGGDGAYSMPLREQRIGTHVSTDMISALALDPRRGRRRTIEMLTMLWQGWFSRQGEHASRFIRDKMAEALAADAAAGGNG